MLHLIKNNYYIYAIVYSLPASAITPGDINVGDMGLDEVDPGDIG